MSSRSETKVQAAISELRAKSTPPHLDDLLDKMTVADVVQMVDPSAPSVTIGHFALIRRIGTGGYGCVIEARDLHLERPVALKLCARNKPDAEELLMAEAQVLASLSHPNIITIHETGHYGEAGEGLFLVMEYAAGGSLTLRALETERMSWRELVPLFADVARGLAAAHDAGVTHGDIKPSNILIHGDGRPQVADFGLARIIGAPLLLPTPIGTLPYAAPELLRGAAPDPLSDQWSFFISLWECLDRRLPFMTNAELAKQVLTLTEAGILALIERWPGLATLHSEVPEALREILRVGLALEAHERFPDMHAVADALAGVFTPPIEEPAASEGEPPPRRGWTNGGLTAFLLALGLGLVGEAYVLGQREGSRVEPTRHELRPPLNTIDRSNSEESSPCVADGVPIEPDASVRAMCRMLRTDGYQAALDLWKELADSRELNARDSHDWLKLACDTTVLAQTFLHEADTAADPERAMQIRESGEQLMRLADTHLSQVTGDETAEAVSQLRSIVARITEPGVN